MNSVSVEVVIVITTYCVWFVCTHEVTYIPFCTEPFYRNVFVKLLLVKSFTFNSWPSSSLIIISTIATRFPLRLTAVAHGQLGARLPSTYISGKKSYKNLVSAVRSITGNNLNSSTNLTQRIAHIALTHYIHGVKIQDHNGNVFVVERVLSRRSMLNGGLR